MEDRRDLEQTLMQGYPEEARQHLAALMRKRVVAELDKLRRQDDAQDNGRVTVD